MCVPSSLSSTISSFRGGSGGLAYNGAAYIGTAAAVRRGGLESTRCAQAASSKATEPPITHWTELAEAVW